tara:strand:- start:125 stop:382 length:258 start_codon:yes stop_codon:yes gene_type:complete
MVKKILKIGSFLTLSFFITFSILFASINPLYALMDQDNIEDNSLGIVIEETSDGTDRSTTSVAPDLGDDQTFPFIPGFGKNSGKD